MNSIPPTLDTLAVRITALEQTATRNSEAHGALYARIEAVEKGQAVINTNLKNIEDMCKEISADVKEMKEKPAKRYDTLVTAVLQGILLAALSAAVIFK